MSIIVATCAYPGTHDVGTSVDQHLTYIAEAKSANADLIVFPEISLQGYPRHGGILEAAALLDAVRRTAEPVPDGPNVARLISAAQAHSMHVVFGVTEAGRQPGICYNTLVLAGPDGYIGSYRKVHLGIPEQMFWRPGNEWPVFATQIGRIGLLICYDKVWPESCRELTLGGAELLVMGAAWPCGGGDDPATSLSARQYVLFERTRAAENGRWFVSANHVGDVGGMRYVGLSQIIDPLGEVVGTSGVVKPGLVLAEVDIEEGLTRAATTYAGAFLIRDRRPETYSILSGRADIAIEG